MRMKGFWAWSSQICRAFPRDEGSRRTPCSPHHSKCRQWCPTLAHTIVAHIAMTNPNAPITLDRILRVLASHSVLSCSVTTNKNGKGERLYGLAPLYKYLVRNQEGVSLAPLVLMNQDKVLMESLNYLKDPVLEDSHPFTRAHGMNAFEYLAIDQRFNRLFNRAMSETSTMLVNKILDTYQGFKEVQELVDVGGGVGSTLNFIVSRYPHISGINFDMPHVVADAPHYPGKAESQFFNIGM